MLDCSLGHQSLGSRAYHSGSLAGSQGFDLELDSYTFSFLSSVALRLALGYVTPPEWL